MVPLRLPEGMVTVPDVAAAEEAVHYALLEHPSPGSLLLIGGGINGSLAEALKHPSLNRVDYVELDPAILDLAAKRVRRFHVVQKKNLGLEFLENLGLLGAGGASQPLGLVAGAKVPAIPGIGLNLD
jgi:hypothetical protein